MKIFFDPLAHAELEDAVEWYEHEKSGLGKKFRDEINCALDRIIRRPTWSIQARPGVFRVRIKIFPYKLLYSLLDDHIVILAISHNHRDPNYWYGRRI